MRVVVIGGLGNFGARICRRLAGEPGMRVIATSRHAKAPPGARFEVAALDVDDPTMAGRLRELRPEVVIHCAGPFQGQDYRVAAATLACGAHYIDLADGRDFVVNFAAQVHSAAVNAGRAAITGASTLPALSSAVVDHLGRRFTQIETIDVVIAPGQHAPRGDATMAAVLSYAGRPFQWWENGAWRKVHGWHELKRIAMPFGLRRAAACDVPDLSLFPERYSGIRTAVFRAALEVPLQQYSLWCLAGLRRMGIAVPAERWASSLNRAAGWFDRFGSDCGGMKVEVRGRDEGGRIRTAIWNLVANSNHGPEVPCMAAIVLTLRIAKGRACTPGASPCMGLLELADFETEFARWDMRTSVEESDT